MTAKFRGIKSMRGSAGARERLDALVADGKSFQVKKGRAHGSAILSGHIHRVLTASGFTLQDDAGVKVKFGKVPAKRMTWVHRADDKRCAGLKDTRILAYHRTVDGKRVVKYVLA